MAPDAQTEGGSEPEFTKYQLPNPHTAEYQIDLYVIDNDPEWHALYWHPKTEMDLYKSLEKHCCLYDVRTEDHLERVIELVSDELTEYGHYESPTYHEVKLKLIKMRASFLEFWNFVVSNNLLLNYDTGEVTTTAEYEPKIAEESMLYKKFRENGFPGFYQHHVIFMQKDAAFFKEEQLYYFLRDRRLLQPIDRFVWNIMTEEWVFKELNNYTKTNIVMSTPEGLVSAFHYASPHVGKTAEQIRTLIRRRRFPFLEFNHFLKQKKLEQSWKHGNDETLVRNHYEAMSGRIKDYYNTVNPALYRLHHAFYIGAKAGLTSEETDAYTFQFEEKDITIDF